jgi:membrane protease YdiL (CAAX protease family)
VFEQIRIVISAGLLMLLLLLRLEAERFAAAEYDEPANRLKLGPWTRLSWYVLGFSLLAGLYSVHPQPHDVLYLILGQRADALAFGLLLALLGVAQAAGFAYYHYRRLRLPPGREYLGAGIDDVATAIIDEATFRGALLGMLLAAHVPVAGAVLAQAIIYALLTRLGAPGRHPYMLALALAIGVVCGWATIHTGGIGAAILGHAMTSYALFVFTGHAGQIAPHGGEPEEKERSRRLPEGWLDARRMRMAAARSAAGADPRGVAAMGARSGRATRGEGAEPKSLGRRTGAGPDGRGAARPKA